MRLVVTALVLVTAALAEAPARADVVADPPVSCPSGSEPATCHGGPHCAALLCGPDAEAGAEACPSGLVCGQVATCSRTINCAGMLPPDTDPSRFDRVTVEGFCQDGCATGTCRTLNLCLRPGTPPGGVPSGDDGGCAGGAGMSGLAALGLVALLLPKKRR